MTDIAINARVECTDGPLGKTTNVIVNPVTKKVTHIVLEDKGLPDNATRMVPFNKVADSTPAKITLSCSKADVTSMPPFLKGQVIQETISGGAWSSGDVYASQYVFNDTAYDVVQGAHIPAGEKAICSGMDVAATDGKVGRLDELVLDPESGDITHILMRKGHLWGKREVAVPASAVDYIEAYTVHLNVDKSAVKEMPEVPVRRPGS